MSKDHEWLKAELARVTAELKAKYSPAEYDEVMRQAKATLERGAAEFKAKFLAERAAKGDVFSPKS